MLSSMRCALARGSRPPARPTLRRCSGWRSELAPDLCARLRDTVQEVSPATFARLAPMPPATGVLAIAARPEVDAGRSAAAA